MNSIKRLLDKWVELKVKQLRINKMKINFKMKIAVLSETSEKAKNTWNSGTIFLSQDFLWLGDCIPESNSLITYQISPLEK